MPDPSAPPEGNEVGGNAAASRAPLPRLDRAATGRSRPTSGSRSDPGSGSGSGARAGATRGTRWRPSLADVIGLALVVAGFVLGLRPFFDNSFFTHLATGRLIMAGGIPRSDPYSFTANGEPWVVQSWLVSTVFGAVERWFGISAVRVLSGLLVAAILVLVWRLTRAAVTLLPRLVIAGFFLVSCSPFLTPRPLLVGLVMLGLALVVVIEERRPWLLVPIMWVWTNAHGSFPLGLVAIGCFAVGAWLDGDRRREIWRPLGWALGGTVLAAVNPLGPTLLIFPVHLLGKMEILSQVVEWKSPDFGAGFTRVFLVEIVVGALLLVRRPSYRVAVPMLVFVASALLGQRNIPDAGLVLVPCLAVVMAKVGNVDGRERGPVPLVLGAAILVAGLLLSSNQLAEPAFDLSTYPTDAMAWLDQYDLIGPEHRVATEDTVGNTLEILYGTDAGAFFDDRYDMYPLELAHDYLRVHGGAQGWEQALDRHQVRYLLWSRSEPVAQLVASSDHWRVLYQDNKAFIACRRGSGAADC